MTLPCSGRAQRPRRRTAARAVGATTAATALVVATALPAFAHVTVSSPDAAPGGYGKLVFSVPNESAKVLTSVLEVSLPAKTPFAVVSAEPVDGWTVSTTERQLANPIKDDDGFNISKAVATVTWTAQPGKGLPPGQFQEFELSVGPFPGNAGKLSLPAIQTYSDGSVVKWDEPTPASGKEPENPAPTLDLTKAATQHTHASTPSTDDSDALARWLGAGGLVLGIVALGVVLTSRRTLREGGPSS